MRLKRNRIFISLIDIVFSILFFIPLALESLRRRKWHSYGEGMKILILELWGIGDLVMMSAILRPLRERFPEGKISLLSNDFGDTLLSASGCINTFIKCNFPWTVFKGKYRAWNWDWPSLIKVIMQLRREKYDLSLDARGDIRNNLLSFLIGAKRRIGYDWTGGGYFLTDVLPHAYEKKHRVEAWIKILDHLHVEAENTRPSLYVSEEEQREADNFLVTKNVGNGDLLIGIHPGAGRKVRCWPLARFAEVAHYLNDKYKARIIVFVEPQGYGNDIPIHGEFIKAGVGLRELKALIKRLSLLICNDSGVMHIAGAVNTKTVAIFGPGDKTRIGPYGENHEIVMDTNVSCRPCFDYCKYPKNFCLESISVNDVVKAISKIIEDTKRNI